MKLKTLFKGLPVLSKISKDIDISGISHHSKRVVPGHLFIARKGERFDGWNFIEEALANGASALLSTQFNPFHKEIQQIIHPKPEELEPILAARFYKHPSQELSVIAVTGTSGKTTVTTLLQNWLERISNQPCGLIGTISYKTGFKTYQAEYTTPDSLVLQKLLREMVEAHCSHVCLEASSHGIVQGRLNEIAIKIGLFTNLRHDHLDYHLDATAYASAKQALFNSEKIASRMHTAVVCDDEASDFILFPFKGRVIRYGWHSSSELRLTEEKLGSEGSHFSFEFAKRSYSAHTRLVGSHNVENCLAALGALIALGFKIEEALPFLPLIKPIAGRLERASTPWAKVYVDYSHKPDALEHALQTLRTIYPNKNLFCLFGCGGDRDRTKRPMMGEIAYRLSDAIWITSDNPRSEEPRSIVEEILRGIPSDFSQTEARPIGSVPKKVLVLLDRQEAIYSALSSMGPNDVLLVAGKGHENYQIVGSRQLLFDDLEVIQNWPSFHKNKRF